MSGCGGNCGSCGGCAGVLSLTRQEIDMLAVFGQIPFLPVARRADSMEPVYLEDASRSKEEYSLLLQCLEKKGLISLDFDMALSGFDYSAYRGYPLQGSMALTQRGQLVLDMLERQGAGS